jgi:hypothetical protein
MLDQMVLRSSLESARETLTDSLAHLYNNLFHVTTLALNDRNHTRSFISLEIARPRATEASSVVGTSRYVLLPLANLLTGYSVKAMERKIERGDWQEGKVWRRAPDGRILIDVLGYQRWVESPAAAAKSHSRGPEGQKMHLPQQMDLAQKREKEIKTSGSHEISQTSAKMNIGA